MKKEFRRRLLALIHASLRSLERNDPSIVAPYLFSVFSYLWTTSLAVDKTPRSEAFRKVAYENDMQELSGLYGRYSKKYLSKFDSDGKYDEDSLPF